MEFLRDALLFLHFLGLASLIGGFLVQIKGPDRRVVPAILHGALTQLVTGGGLVAVLHAQDEAMNGPKIAVKMAVALTVTVLAWLTRKPTSLGSGLFFSMFALAVLNVGVAVFW